MLKEYKNQILYFIKNKKYIIPVILVTILSFGFTVTHESIGIDDLSLDKYVSGTFWLSSKRFGMFLIYNILNIKEFTPFWLDFIVALFMPTIAIFLCAFVRKNFNKIIKNTLTYTIFSTIFISNPLINHFYIYQASNIALVISNLLTILLAVSVFELYFNQNKNKKQKSIIIILSGILMGLILSIYESCAQTYLIFIFMSIFLKLTSRKNEKENKDVLKYFFINILILLIGVILYIVVNKIIILALELTRKFSI